MNNLTVRTATPDDIGLITQFTYSIHQHEDNGQLKDHNKILSNLKKWLLSELMNSQSLYLIAEINSSAVGFIGATSIINDNGFIANPLKGVIQLLWVIPEFRSNQVARTLVNNIEICLKDIGIEYVECGFTSKNAQAGKFWKKMEYKTVSLTARKFLN